MTDSAAMEMCDLKHDVKVTILVPVYNEEKYLQSSLECIRRQTYQDFRCVVADNASTDKSGEICRSYVERDPRFHFFRHESNIGSYRNTRFLLKQVKTPYFMLFAGHDLMETTFLEKTVRFLDHDSTCSMAFSKVRAIYDEEPGSTALDAAEYKFSRFNLLRFLQSAKQLKNCTMAQSVVRSSCLDDFEFPEDGFNAWDHNLISHMLWHGNIHFVQEYLYFRRYFRERRTGYMERISGQNKVAGYDYSMMVHFYLDDISRFYQGRDNIVKILQWILRRIFAKRYGKSFYLEHY
jgi:glycosyltransferase involved in cell wall biosynthesis